MKDTWVNSKIPFKSQPFLFRLSFVFLISLLKPLLLRLIKFNIHGIFLIYASELAILWSRKAQGEEKKKLILWFSDIAHAASDFNFACLYLPVSFFFLFLFFIILFMFIFLANMGWNIITIHRQCPWENTSLVYFLDCWCFITKSCLTLRDPMDCSTLGFPVLHHLPEFSQTHMHWVGDAMQPPHPLSPFSFLLVDLNV